MMTQRLLVVLCLLVALAGCRPGVTSEGSLPASVFERPGASLTKDSAGLWYVVAGVNEPLRDLVVVEHDGITRPFYAIATGERAAQLLPLTAVTVSWFNGAMQNRQTSIRFIESLESVNINGGLALWSGDGADVTWLGATPRGEQLAVVLQTSAPARGTSFSKSMRGLVAVGDGGVRVIHGAFPADKGPYLVLPDGAIKDDVFEVADLRPGNTKLPSRKGFSINKHEMPGPASLARLKVLQMGRTLGADALVMAAHPPTPSKIIATLVDPENARIGRYYRMEAALAEVALELASEDDLMAVLNALRAMRDNHPMVAAYWLADVDFEVGRNATAAEFRRAELVAAAGLGPWMRAELLDGRDGDGADVAIYLARSYMYEGNWEAAAAFAARAHRFFEAWPQPHGLLGQGRADDLLARIEAERGEFREAAALSGSASTLYGRVGDEVRAATSQLHRARYAHEAGDSETARAAASQARSTFGASGAPYQAALAKAALAGMLLEAGADAQAYEVANTALESASREGEPIALNRAKILNLQTRQRAESGFDARPELWSALQRANTQRDRVGAMAAAAALALAPGASDHAVVLGGAITAGMLVTADYMLLRDAEAAMNRLCTGTIPLAHAEAAALERTRRACLTRREDAEFTPEWFGAWLDTGYRHVLSQEWAQARAVTAAMDAQLTRAFMQRNEARLAEVQFLKAALIQGEQSASSTAPGTGEQPKAPELVTAGFEIIRKNVDIHRTAAHLAKLAVELESRGQDWLALTLARASVQAAVNRRQDELVGLHTLLVARLLHQAGEWGELAGLNAPGGGLVAVKTRLLQANAMDRSGEDGAPVRKAALEALGSLPELAQIEGHLWASRLELERGNTQAAADQVAAAHRIERALPTALVSTYEAREMVAARHLAQARVHHASGRPGEAQTEYHAALAAVTELALPTGAMIRIEALVGLGSVANSPGELAAARAKAVRDLDGLVDGIARTGQRDVLQRLYGAQIKLLIEDGTPVAAWTRLETAMARGISPLPLYADASCLQGLVGYGSENRTGADKALRYCVRHAADPLLKAQAALLLALADRELSLSERIERAQRLQEALEAVGHQRDTSLEMGRVRFVIAHGLASNLAAQGEEKRRLDAIARESAPGSSAIRRVAAVTSYAEFLLSSGQATRVGELLDKHSGSFHDAGEESVADLMRLRLATMTRLLRPVEALAYLERASSELSNVGVATSASLKFLKAQNHAMLGQWHLALEAIRDAEALALQANDQALLRDIQAFTTRYITL